MGIHLWLQSTLQGTMLIDTAFVMVVFPEQALLTPAANAAQDLVRHTYVRRESNDLHLQRAWMVGLCYYDMTYLWHDCFIYGRQLLKI